MTGDGADAKRTKVLGEIEALNGNPGSVKNWGTQICPADRLSSHAQPAVYRGDFLWYDAPKWTRSASTLDRS
jgi:hypothetical protein